MALIDGGAGGPAHQEMVDYFYYAQLRAQGEDTTEPRQITGLVPISEVGNLMRSLGFYPSEKEVEDLMVEAQVICMLVRGPACIGGDASDICTKRCHVEVDMLI